MNYAANDQINVALIGAGGMGNGDLEDAVSLPGVKFVAAADTYDGRLARLKEVYGSDVFTTRDYREVLSRKDVDAVIIATPDHWHSRISIDAMRAGKDVYCEKPMVQKVEQGEPVIAAMKETTRIFQVGSQYASALAFQKIRELLQQGAIGELNMVQAWLDRNTAIGAWQYSIPPDASEKTVDWDRFQGDAPKHAFDPKRVFRWRNYRDYGTAVAGDLYVHLLTGLHTATGALGPKRIYSTGGLRYWNDGRDVPDTMFGIIEYPKTEAHPEFTFSLSVNFKASEPQERFGFKFIGSEGTITTDVGSVTLNKKPREKEPGYTVETFTEDMQKRYIANYRQKYPEVPSSLATMDGDSENKWYARQDAHLAHMTNFISAVRSRQPFFEDAVFGFRAAGPALLCNTSYFENRICYWDAENMKAS